jgi:hypothetical protein
MRKVPEDAQAYCSAPPMNAYLMVPNSQAESKFIADYLTSVKVPIRSSYPNLNVRVIKTTDLCIFKHNPNNCQNNKVEHTTRLKKP